MASSPARIAANQANALKSTGPRTDEGKAIARRNSLKHGLTGGGVVIPGEDQGAVADRCDALAAELAPDGDSMSLILSQRVAMLSVRSERCYRHDVAATAERVRNAGEDFDEARRARADHLMSFLHSEPLTFARQLRAMPEGVDLLLREFKRLRKVANGDIGERWVVHHGYQVNAFTGWHSGDRPLSRCDVLCKAIDGHFEHLADDEGGDLEPIERIRWAHREMVKLIDAEIAKLEAHRPTLDFAAIARSRAEAGQRALVDTTPTGLLARKYEAATERSLFRAIQALRDLKKDQAKGLYSRPFDVAQERRANDEQLPEMLERDRPVAPFFPIPTPPPGPIDLPALTAAKPPTHQPAPIRDRKKRPKLKS